MSEKNTPTSLEVNDLAHQAVDLGWGCELGRLVELAGDSDMQAQLDLIVTSEQASADSDEASQEESITRFQELAYALNSKGYTLVERAAIFAVVLRAREDE